MGGVNPNGQDTLVDLEVVKAAEIDHLRQRRGGLGEWSELRDPLNGIAGDDNPLAELFSDTADKAWADHPSLFGIALSGGGIRSATFSLGVLQALAARGLFRQAHYLSTVSGGGYMGGCFNAMNATPPEGEQKGMEAVFAHKAYQQESAAFRHLRAYSRFLAPSGAADTLRMVAQPLMGTLTNLAVLLSLMLFVAAVGGMLSFIRPVAWPWLGAAIGLTWFSALGIWMQFQQCDPLDQRDKIGGWLGWSLVFLAVMVFWDIQPMLIHWLFSSETDWTQWTFWGATPTAIATFLAKRVQGQGARLRMKLLLVAVGTVVPLAVLYGYLWLASQIVLEVPAWWHFSTGIAALDWCLAYGLSGLILGFVTKLVNLNITSPHRFYRDRISRAYIFRQADNGNDIQSLDDLKLSKLQHPDFRAPYPIINATLNVSAAGGGKHLAEMVRHAEWFMFSKLYIGAQSTGFRSTTVMEDRDPYVNLATAVAISGAAASPNMGQIDLPELRMLMTLLNVRLGYWLSNPAKPDTGRMDALKLLRTEMIGAVSSKGDFVNVSDGGHVENLGVYALIQRQCRLIIASDAEADGGYDLPALTNLIRMIRIDMGLFLTFEADDIKALKEGKRHWLVGRIYYSDDRQGLLLYLKASLTGDEDPTVLAYRQEYPAFPHESTADQFFSEQQFEAYRWLGYHVANKAVAGVTS
jgi:hypothetical protein